MTAKACTVFTGRSPGDRCRKTGQLRRVETRVGGVTKHIHYICEDCRKEMKFPDEDIILEPLPQNGNGEDEKPA